MECVHDPKTCFIKSVAVAVIDGYIKSLEAQKVLEKYKCFQCIVEYHNQLENRGGKNAESRNQ